MKQVHRNIFLFMVTINNLQNFKEYNKCYNIIWYIERNINDSIQSLHNIKCFI